MDIRK